MERRAFIRNASIAVASLSALGIAGKLYSNTTDVSGKILTIYSGRKEKLVGPLIEKIKLETLDFFYSMKLLQLAPTLKVNVNS